MITAKLHCSSCGAKSPIFYGVTGKELSFYITKGGWNFLSTGESVCPRCIGGMVKRAVKGAVRVIG